MNAITKIKSIAAKLISHEFKQSIKAEISDTKRTLKAHMMVAKWARVNQKKKEELAWKGEYVVTVTGFFTPFDTWYVTKEILINLNKSEKKEIQLNRIKLHPSALELEQWEKFNLVKDVIIVDKNNCFLYGAKAYSEARLSGKTMVTVYVTNVEPIYPNH